MKNKKTKNKKRSAIKPSLTKVTQEHLEVLQLTAENYTPQQVADIVKNITARGVEQRLSVLYLHLGVNSAIAAYRKVLMLGLMPLR